MEVMEYAESLESPYPHECFICLVQFEQSYPLRMFLGCIMGTTDTSIIRLSCCIHIDGIFKGFRVSVPFRVSNIDGISVAVSVSFQIGLRSLGTVGTAGTDGSNGDYAEKLFDLTPRRKAIFLDFHFVDNLDTQITVLCGYNCSFCLLYT